MIYEKQWFVFDPEISNLPDNTFLCGYWQSEKYFKDIEDIIRRELSLKETLTEKSEAFARRISTAKNTVSLHIRRGDYVTDVKTNNYLGLCSLEYYRECISILVNKFGSLNVFVFSDDTSWAKENLSYATPTPVNFYFVDHNGIEYAYEDMYLMSICEHNIIANSSFSWWGAWLNMNKNKIVFAPKNWINDESFTALDIIPDNWYRI
jgi:hypothetical protein